MLEYLKKLAKLRPFSQAMTEMKILLKRNFYEVNKGEIIIITFLSFS